VRFGACEAEPSRNLAWAPNQSRGTMSLILRLRAAPRPCLRTPTGSRRLVRSAALPTPYSKPHALLLKCNPLIITASARPFSSSSLASFFSSPFRRTISPVPQPKEPNEDADKNEVAPETPRPAQPTLRENIYTIPNLLTLSRIAACPIIGYAILHDQFWLSTSLLAYASFSDWVRYSSPV
jgi:hypothetical protein